MMKTRKIHILIVDDDKYFRMALKELLGEHAVFTEADSENEAFLNIERNHYDIALIDMEIDSQDSGIRILNATKNKKIHSIVISSQNDDRLIEQAYAYGCNHFLTKLHFRENLEPYILKFIKTELNNELYDFFTEKFITQDIKLKEEISKICQINLKDHALCISGETGVGKSLVAELIHNYTHGDSRPFIHINCSEISENLLESELFGHEKGAFTGAETKKIGKLELANKGTLFLDEIATMPMIMQKKLLKALDQKTFYPVGSQKPIKSEFMIITATCEDLFEKIHNGEFRKDLFFRITGINLHIPPLRERVGDIPLLIKHIVGQSHRRFIIKDDALALLRSHSWPGNIRELKKKINLLAATGNGIIRSGDIELNHASDEASSYTLTNDQKAFIHSNGLRDFIQKIEQESIVNTLQNHQGKITYAIKELKISASAFYRIFNQVN